MKTKIARKLIEDLMNMSSPDKKKLDLMKLKIAGLYHAESIPSNSEIIEHLKPWEKEKLLPILRRKTMRTISGVAVIAVMTKPWPCPQPNPCAYCPSWLSSGVPQSYTGHEPASMRGIQHGFDPYKQTKQRMNQLKAIGHPISKIELIVMGGTFPSMPIEYQKHFIKRCLDAISGMKSRSIEEAKKNAESSPLRNVGLTVETRPDWSKENHVDLMLSLGVTRVELGVQNIYDDIYKKVNRGHTVKDVIEATRILKDAGLKVVYHMMPGLPGSSHDRDLEAFKRIFQDEEFKPDMLKIYPCIITKRTKIYEWYKNGTYNPYTTEESVDLISKVKEIVPRWVRIMRIQRDIPAYLIEAGVKKSNLRQLVKNRLKSQDKECSCIRCREVGHRLLQQEVTPDPNSVTIQSVKYSASEGKELFISAEDRKKDVLIGYLRLRFPSEKKYRLEMSLKKTSIIRELRVCGSLMALGKRKADAWQHRGFGRLLLERAEELSTEHEMKKILVTSALGTKLYYKKLGYVYDDAYMSKILR